MDNYILFILSYNLEIEHLRFLDNKVNNRLFFLEHGNFLYISPKFQKTLTFKTNNNENTIFNFNDRNDVGIVQSIILCD
jgi:hypothetical protein